MSLTVAGSNLLQRKYLNDITVAIDFAATSYNMAAKQAWKGSLMEWRVQTKYMNSISGGSDGGAYPVATTPTLLTAQVGRKFMYASAEQTYGILAASKGGENAFKDSTDFLVRNLSDSIAKFKNGFFFGDGSGVVARAVTTSGTTNIQLAAQVAGRNASGLSLVWDGNNYDVYDSTGVTKRSTQLQVGARNVLPTANLSNIAVDLASGATLPSGYTAGDLVVWQNSFGLVYDGLQSLINDDTSGTFQGITYANDPSARSYVSTVLSNSGNLRQLTPDLFRSLHEGIFTRSGEKPSSGLKYFCHPTQMTNFADMYEGELRIAPSDKVVGNGAVTIQTPFGQAELVPDVDCAPSVIFAADMSQIEFCTQMPLAFVNPVYGSGGMFQSSMQAAVLDARMIEIAQMRIKDRKSSGKIVDLQYSLKSNY
jgi:hypothetical protein